MIFTGADGVLQAEIDRVKTHCPGDLFHVPVQRPISLRHAVSTVSASGRCIGVNHICVEADVRRFAIFAIADVQSHGFVPGIAGHGQCVTTVRARIRKGVHGIGCDRAVFLHAGLHLDSHRVA